MYASVNKPSLVQIMACRLVGAKPLSEPMLEYFQLNPWEQTSGKSYSKSMHFHSTYKPDMIEIFKQGQTIKDNITCKLSKETLLLLCNHVMDKKMASLILEQNGRYFAFKHIFVIEIVLFQKSLSLSVYCQHQLSVMGLQNEFFRTLQKSTRNMILIHEWDFSRFQFKEYFHTDCIFLPPVSDVYGS